MLGPLGAADVQSGQLQSFYQGRLHQPIIHAVQSVELLDGQYKFDGVIVELVVPSNQTRKTVLIDVDEPTLQYVIQTDGFYRLAQQTSDLVAD